VCLELKTGFNKSNQCCFKMNVNFYEVDKFHVCDATLRRKVNIQNHYVDFVFTNHNVNWTANNIAVLAGRAFAR
jgi:hypothetical protein